MDAAISSLAGDTDSRESGQPFLQPLENIVACDDCDLLHRVPPIHRRGRAHCTRCNSLLYSKKPDWRYVALPLTMTSVFLIIMVLAFPLLSFSLAGRAHDIHLITGVRSLYSQHMVFLAFVVAMSSIVAPILRIAGLLYVLMPLYCGGQPPMRKFASRVAHMMKPWGMFDVFFLSALVTVIKLSERADIGMGIAFYAFAALVVVSSAAASSIDPQLLWRAECVTKDTV